MSKLKYFTDEHVSMRFINELKKRNITVIRCEDVGLKEASDEELLTYAAENKCTLISMDDDVTRLHKKWLAEDKVHYGIFYAPMEDYQGTQNIGHLIQVCADYAMLIEEHVGTIEDDMKNRLEFL